MSSQDVNETSFGSGAAASEKRLWDSFKQGDPVAFEQLYKVYANTMYNYGMHLFMNSTLVEDAIQDVFVEIWNRKSFLGEVTSLKFYLLKSLKNKILRRMEAEERIAKHLNDALSPEVEESIETRSILEQSTRTTINTVRKAIEHLPPKQREIIEQRFYDGKSAQEISDAMKISIDSTYTLLSRAIHSLRKSLKTAGT